VSIATTHVLIVRAERIERERTYPQRYLRHVDRLINWALDQVERVTLAGGGECPCVVGDLVEQLQLLAAEPTARPITSSEAHEQLLHLAAVLLGLPEDDATCATAG
jgi:hypothetical protein